MLLLLKVIFLFISCSYFLSSLAGARIINHSEVFFKKDRIVYLFSIPLYYHPPNKADILLQRSSMVVSEHDCWLTKGGSGYFEVKLAKEVEIYSLEYRHYNQADGKFSSATPLFMDITVCLHVLYRVYIITFRLVPAILLLTWEQLSLSM